MTNNRDRSLIALILILVGVIFLGETIGFYNFSIIFFLRSYWPGLLIIFGFHILLQNNKFWYIVPLIVTGLAIYMLYMLYTGKPFYFRPNFKMRIFNFRHFF